MISKQLTLLIGIAALCGAFCVPMYAFGQKGTPGDKAGAGSGKAVKEKPPMSKKGDDARPEGDKKLPGMKKGNPGQGPHDAADGPGKGIGLEKGAGLGHGKGEGAGHGRDMDGDTDGARQGDENADADDATGREARRARHREKLKVRRAALENNPKHFKHFKAAKDKKGKVPDEQRKHLKRMAHLKQMMLVAKEQNKKDVIVKLRALKTKEMARHRKTMTKLQTTGGTGK